MKAAIFIANGFEEIEALVPFDVLKRAGITVVTFGIDSKHITGAHGLKIETDRYDAEYTPDFDVLILPGGMPGATNLASSKMVVNALLEQEKKNKLIAAICASPAVVLGPLGILEGKEATCFPGCDREFYPSFEFSNELVVKSKNLITGKGPGAAWNFSLEIINSLVMGQEAEKIIKSTYLPIV